MVIHVKPNRRCSLTDSSQTDALTEAARHEVEASPAVRFAKRSVDLVGSICGLIALSPLLIPIALAIRLDSPGPALFRQLRIGRGSPVKTELFEMIKFRTMYTDADKRTGAVWASKDDPRITKVGNILRKTRLDELPQLWNVLKGEMSLIGPRPEQLGLFGKLEREVPFYAERVYGVRPGITGYAQVEVGYDTSIEDVRNKILHDFAYALSLRDLWSWIKMDTFIIWQTFLAVIGRKGQ